MSDSRREITNLPSLEDDAPSKGPSLTLMYSIVALALVAALVCAGLIVLPFYLRR